MCVELSDKPIEHNASTIVEVAPVICLNDLMHDIKGCYHNISPDNIPLWNDWPVSYSSSGRYNAFPCPLSDLALRAVGKHDSAKNNQKIFAKKIIPMILDYVSPKKNWHCNDSKMDFPKITNILISSKQSKQMPELITHTQQYTSQTNLCYLYLKNIPQKYPNS